MIPETATEFRSLLTFLLIERAACTKSLPWADVLAASFIFSDSSIDLHKEAMYSTEPSEAFEISSCHVPDYNEAKKHNLLN